jgi:DNA-binding response OmpR family regulator
VARILIVEDEPRIASFLEKGLKAQGYSTFVVDSGRMAASVARDGNFDLMILDLGLPDIDGLEALQDIRRHGERLPVIILTARPDATVAGFETGADDYVTKPFRLDELVARIRARLRTRSEDAAGLTVGQISLDVRTRRATVDGQEIELTAREFAMLETFMRHPDQVLSREQLLSHVWGYDFDPGSNVVEVYVRALRKKLGDQVVDTVRGMGYRMPQG